MIAELTVLSAAFAMGQTIPAVYTCTDRDISPPIRWEQTPEGVKSFALIADDPDAPMGTWVHWVIFNIPPNQTELAEDIPKRPTLPGGLIQGMNDFGRHGYGGPCPPPGKPHRYFFKVYALDTLLDLGSSARKRDLLRAMEGHILAEGELMGLFER